MEILAYLNYCAPGQAFFDAPDRNHGRFVLSDAPAPQGWRWAADSEWVNFLPPATLAGQGWKVHVSATMANCNEVLQICWDFCTAAGIGFKFLKSTEVLFHRSSKYGDRTASGKFVTIYPPDDGALQLVLRDLGAKLAGFVGPTILSDLRWRSGPLYLRYGAFTKQIMQTSSGEVVMALRGPDGAMVPDERRPGFHVPDWVALPPVLVEAMQARDRGRLTDFPYRPTQALHFSNGGGVYRGVDSGQGAIILKEARPYAGIDGAGEDAVARLEREHWALGELTGMAEMPRLIDYRRGHEHFFLIREDVEGVALMQRAATLNPILRAGATQADFVEYTAWAIAKLDAIEAGVAEMHRRGVTYRDLHPGNILVRPDDSLAFIDLEASRPVADDVAQTIGAPGYMAPPNFRGPDVDRYALGIFALDLFVPLAQVVQWGQHKIDEILRLVERDFPVPNGFAARVRAFLAAPAAHPEHSELQWPSIFIAGEPIPDRIWSPDGVSAAASASASASAAAADAGKGWNDLAEMLAAAITSQATVERPDRLYPGDPATFRSLTGGVGFLYGAAGVLWALRRSDIRVPETHLEWFRSAVDSARWESCGFAEGACGAALTLDALGEQERAHDALEQAIRLSREGVPGRLADGLAGVGLTMLALASNGREESLVRAAEALTPRINAWVLDPRDRRWGPGLLGGPAGLALFFIRLHECTGEPDLLDQAAGRLREELAGWGWNPDGLSDVAALKLPEAMARSVYLGSAGGTALVLQEFLRHRADPELERVMELLREACSVPFTPESGLLYGRAGLIAVLAGIGGSRSRIDSHVADLRVHSVLLGGRPFVTGRYALRASCDLATGSAGLLLALKSLQGRAMLPFHSSADAHSVVGPDQRSTHR